MNSRYKWLYPLLGWVITLAVPLLLITTSIRLVLNPWFVEFEYRTPAFPADPYGFTLEDRLKYSKIAIDYLVNDAGPEFLGDLKFTDGTPLYNQRELSHMVDVKTLTQTVIKGWIIGLAVFALLGIWAYLGGWWPIFRRALARGGWITLGLVVVVLAAVAVSFSALFTGFHRIFFEGDTWLFYYSDTLIRLFPMRLWRDVFIIIGRFTIIGGLLLAIFANRPKRVKSG
jgi:integral membrane protein (TIGR01906 family)